MVHFIIYAVIYLANLADIGSELIGLCLKKSMICDFSRCKVVGTRKTGLCI